MLTLQILIRGRAIPTYNDTSYNTFVEGRRGSAYTLKVFNSAPLKQKAVISVDGMNVLSGDATWERGYVVPAYGNIEIPGWRVDASKVAQFVFADLKDSYRNAATAESNRGVIGLRAFQEILQPVYPTILWNTSTPYLGATGPTGSTGPIGAQGSNGNRGPAGSSGDGSGVWLAASGATGPTLNNNTRSYGGVIASRGFASVTESQSPLGTGWGEEKQFNTSTDYTNFQPNHSQTVVIYYDSAKGLERRGIFVRGHNSTPDPFPTASNNGDGCPPPRR